VWNTKLENFFYYRHRIWAQRVGASRTISHHQRKLPALITKEQTGLIFGYKGSGTAFSLNREKSLCDIIHADLVHRGYITSSACRYGGDYVIYEAHPSVCHSSHTIRILENDEQIPSIDVAGYCRVQSSVLKKAVFATTINLTRGRAPIYININYNPTLSNDPSKKLERRLSRAIVESPVSPRAIEAKRRYDEIRAQSTTPNDDIPNSLLGEDDDDEFQFGGTSHRNERDADGASDEDALLFDEDDDEEDNDDEDNGDHKK